MESDRNLFALKTGEAGADLTTRPLFTADHNHTNTWRSATNAPTY